jgi:hypothetical protein
MSSSTKSLLEVRAIIILRKKRRRCCSTKEVWDKDYKGRMTVRQRKIIFKRVKALEKLEREDHLSFLRVTLPKSLAEHLPDAIQADLNHHTLEEDYE